MPRAPDSQRADIPADLFESPEMLPMHIDLDERLIWFFRVTKASYHMSSFLDQQRTVRQDTNIYSLSIDGLLDRYETEAPGPLTTHFLFYDGYNGSTLLARSVQEISGCLVLKEPRILYWFFKQKMRAGKVSGETKKTI
ncbi:MAG: hypothetical protein OEU26_10795 [Candidatus Tectomicrobia bacterium]|nr:hypothetical protein [Candidatus Tectomicrobia bacterium]